LSAVLAIRGFASWQTTIADLALILFLITASALSAAPSTEDVGANDTVSGLFHTELANASAIYRPGAGAPPLAEWLADQAADPRQRLTILVRYGSDGETEAAVQALALLEQAGAAWPAPRVVLEAGKVPLVLVMLAYDLEDVQPENSLAQPLH